MSASGGARGLGADRAAKGGSNPAIVKTTVTAAESTTFRRASCKHCDARQAHHEGTKGTKTLKGPLKSFVLFVSSWFVL